MSTESSIFATILADIEDNPTILHKQKNWSHKNSIFTTILDDLSPKILHKTKNTSLDVSPTAPPQTLTRSEVVNKLNQELKILKSEIDSKDCSCVEDKSLGDEKVLQSDDLKYFDDLLSTMLGDEVNEEEDCEGIDEFMDEMLEKVQEDRSYLGCVKAGFVFGGLLESLLRDRLREKEEEEKEVSSWITNGEPQTETETLESDIKKTKKKSPVQEEEPATKTETLESDIKKKSPVQEEETSVMSSKRDWCEYKTRLYLMEKLREREEKKRERRVRVVRFGVEFSYLLAEYMFLRPDDVLADETEEFWLCLKRLGVDKDDKSMNVVIGKVEEVVKMVMRKKENKEHYNVDFPFPKSSFRFEDYVRLCADAILALGNVVWSLRRNETGRLEVSCLDALFQDCEKVLVKLDLKMAEMKESVYRSVSADYESFSKSERFDVLLRSKVVKRVNADNRFQRSMIGSYLVDIWKYMFQSESLHEQRK